MGQVRLLTSLLANTTTASQVAFLTFNTSDTLYTSLNANTVVGDTITIEAPNGTATYTRGGSAGQSFGAVTYVSGSFGILGISGEDLIICYQVSSGSSGSSG